MDDIYLPEALTDQALINGMFGGLKKIPKAMPYPSEGYMQLFQPEFKSLDNVIVAPDGAPPYWPLWFDDDAFVGCTNCIYQQFTVNHNNLDWPAPWWLRNVDLDYADMGAHPPWLSQ